jgi:hypothetical protein
VPDGWPIWLALLVVYVGLTLALRSLIRNRATVWGAALTYTPLAVVLLAASLILASPLPLILAVVVIGRRVAVILWFWRHTSPRRAALGYAGLTSGLLVMPTPSLIASGDYGFLLVWLGVVLVLGVLAYGFIAFVLRSLGGEFDAKAVNGDIRGGGP